MVSGRARKTSPSSPRGPCVGEGRFEIHKRQVSRSKERGDLQKGIRRIFGFPDAAADIAAQHDVAPKQEPVYGRGHSAIR